MPGIESRVIEERKQIKVEFAIAEELWKRYLVICEQLGANPKEVLPLLIREEIYTQAARIEHEKMSEEEKERERLDKLKENAHAVIEEIFKKF